MMSHIRWGAVLCIAALSGACKSREATESQSAAAALPWAGAACATLGCNICGELGKEHKGTKRRGLVEALGPMMERNTLGRLSVATSLVASGAVDGIEEALGEMDYEAVRGPNDSVEVRARGDEEGLYFDLLEKTRLNPEHALDPSTSFEGPGGATALIGEARGLSAENPDISARLFAKALEAAATQGSPLSNEVLKGEAARGAEALVAAQNRNMMTQEASNEIALSAGVLAGTTGQPNALVVAAAGEPNVAEAASLGTAAVLGERAVRGQLLADGFLESVEAGRLVRGAQALERQLSAAMQKSKSGTAEVAVAQRAINEWSRSMSKTRQFDAAVSKKLTEAARAVRGEVKTK